MQETWHEKYKAAGRCVNCPNPAKPDSVRCQACVDKRAAKRKEKVGTDVCPGCDGLKEPSKWKTCAKCRQKQRDRYSKNIDNGICTKCHKKTAVKTGMCEPCYAKSLVQDGQKRKRLLNQVLEAYGSKCACCGETEILFLQVDHKNNDGNLHRKELKEKTKSKNYSGTRFYIWLRQQGFPKDKFQLLCANCNSGKARNGGICPHHNKKKDSQ